MSCNQDPELRISTLNSVFGRLWKLCELANVTTFKLLVTDWKMKDGELSTFGQGIQPKKGVNHIPSHRGYHFSCMLTMVFDYD